MGQAHMGAVFNKDGYPLVDNYTYGQPNEGPLSPSLT